MAAGDSPTSVSNLALSMLGEDPIANVDPPDNSRAGRLCRQFYDTSRRAILQASPWREAKRQAPLAAAATSPGFTYGAAYPVPRDFIRFYELPEDGQAAWELMNLDGIGLCIVTDAGPPLDCTYVFDLTDCTQMSPLLIKGIAADMGANMALPLTRDMAMKTACEAARETYLSTAKTTSAQQASPRQLDADVLLSVRW